VTLSALRLAENPHRVRGCKFSPNLRRARHGADTGVGVTGCAEESARRRHHSGTLSALHFLIVCALPVGVTIKAMRPEKRELPRRPPDMPLRKMDRVIGGRQT
jgi:hypothetical protein